MINTYQKAIIKASKTSWRFIHAHVYARKHVKAHIPGECRGQIYQNIFPKRTTVGIAK